MKKPKVIKLKEGERIIAVIPERCAGPGWVNAPTWVYIVDREKKLRMEDIQPEERTPALHALFNPGESMCNALLYAVPVKKV